MKKYLIVLSFFVATQAIALTETAKTQIMYLDSPYAITNLAEFDIDCVWTKDEKGNLQSEASGPIASGVCWNSKSVDQARKMDEEGSLAWYPPPSFDHEYGNKAGCYYKVDKQLGLVHVLLGGNLTGPEENECREPSSMQKAINLATKTKKEVKFGGYIATEDNILGAVTLACYTGSLNSKSLTVSEQERASRYKALTGLYEHDGEKVNRVKRAFIFAENNLRDRYPLDTRGNYRVAICDQMVLKGKL